MESGSSSESESDSFMKYADSDSSDSEDTKAGGKGNKDYNFLNRLQARDKDLFKTSKNGNYSRICPGSSQSRYPVVLNDAEKNQIDSKDSTEGKESYQNALKHRNNWYICPRYWNFLENRSMSEIEFEKNPDMKKFITDKEIGPDKYIYQFTKGKRFKNGVYKEHYPGFVLDKSDSGVCLPCCFSENKAALDNKMKCQSEEKTEDVVLANNKHYILESYPLPQFRWGYLPKVLQNHLDKKGSKTMLLRYGVENVPHPSKQSFMACLADLYSDLKNEKAPVSVADMSLILASAITLDEFLQFQNGSFISAFRPDHQLRIDETKFHNSNLYKNTDPSNPVQVAFFKEMVRCFHTFRQFLRNPDSVLDYQYLWDILVVPHPKIIPTGLNMIIFKVDTAYNILGCVCPTNVMSQEPIWDDKKPTWILIEYSAMAGKELSYEPIYLYDPKLKTPKTRLLEPNHAGAPFLKEMVESILSNCDIPIEWTASYIVKKGQNTLQGFSVQKQLANTHGQIVGFLYKVETQTKPNRDRDRDILHYMPCYPSAPLPNLKINTLGGTEIISQSFSETWKTLSLWKDVGIHAYLISPTGELGGQVYGLLTNYMGFIPFSESVDLQTISQVTNTPVKEVKKKIVKMSNPMNLEMSVKTERQREKTREELDRVGLETAFFKIFWTRLREIVNEWQNEKHKTSMMKWIDTQNYDMKEKQKQLVLILRFLSFKKIVFNDIDDSALWLLQKKMSSNEYFMLTKNSADTKIILPRRNLKDSKIDNETFYFNHLSNLLIRNPRMRNVFLQPFDFYNFVNTREFLLNKNEILLTETEVGET